MQRQAKVFVSGVVLIGIVTAFGLHSKGLPKLLTNTSAGISTVLGRAETG